MKSSNLSKVVGAGLLVASLATLPLGFLSAQNGTLRDSGQLLLVTKPFTTRVKSIKVSVRLIGLDRLYLVLCELGWSVS